jgi:tetratricopeptide (TPR) repeat protein
VRSSPRHAARRALELVRVAPPARVLAELDEVVAHFPGSSLPTCHRGELHLWLGDAARARDDFRRSIELCRETRFAYIGLAGAALLEGRARTALNALDEGVRVMSSEGPASFAYRAEALRLLGRLEAARAEAERAVAQRPSRTGAWILLALVRHELGDTIGAREATARVVAAAPALLEDAEQEALGRPARDDGDAARALEHALRMLRGNRSSTCLTYFTASGELRALERLPR